MLCNGKIVWATRNRKGRKEPYQKAVKVYHSGYPPELIDGDAVICGGEIKADIYAHEEAYWGGSAAELSINYKCNKCGSTYHHELPTSPEALSEFVTKAIRDL